MGEFVVNPILMLTASTDAEFTSTVVISGILIVLGVLILLIFVFYLFGVIVQKMEGIAKSKKSKKLDASNENTVNNIPIPVKPKAPAPNVEKGISGEVVAAIAAAVVATEGQGAVVRSIKRKNVGGRNPWAQAANIDNTRPF